MGVFAEGGLVAVGWLAIGIRLRGRLPSLYPLNILHILPECLKSPLRSGKIS
jgi:hypothetical protein